MDIKTKVNKAFKELEALGAPAKSSECYPDRGLFWLDAEDDTDGVWLDYFNLYWGSDKLKEILGKYDLYFEWDNPGYASVYEI
jgi:hypothetical protein